VNPADLATRKTAEDTLRLLCGDRHRCPECGDGVYPTEYTRDDQMLHITAECMRAECTWTVVLATARDRP
jgi:ribosomal protein S27AE